MDRGGSSKFVVRCGKGRFWTFWNIFHPLHPHIYLGVAAMAVTVLEHPLWFSPFYTTHGQGVWVGAYRNRCQQLVQPVDGAFFRDRNGIAFHFPQDIRRRGLFTVSFRANWGNWRKKILNPPKTQVLLPSRGSGEIMINYFTRSFMGMCLSCAISSSRNGSTRLDPFAVNYAQVKPQTHTVTCDD